MELDSVHPWRKSFALTSSHELSVMIGFYAPLNRSQPLPNSEAEKRQIAGACCGRIGVRFRDPYKAMAIRIRRRAKGLSP